MNEYKTFSELTCVSSAKLLELTYFLLGSASKTYANAVRASTPGKSCEQRKKTKHEVLEPKYLSNREQNDFHYLDDVYIVQLIGNRKN